MSENKNALGHAGVLLLAGVLGVLATVGFLAAAAEWMAAKGCSGSMAQPLATAAVGAGSLCSGFAAALCAKERRVLYGLMQGCLLAVLWGGIAAAFGMAEESTLIMRCAVAVLCGGIGGAMVLSVKRKRRG